MLPYALCLGSDEESLSQSFHGSSKERVTDSNGYPTSQARKLHGGRSHRTVKAQVPRFQVLIRKPSGLGF